MLTPESFSAKATLRAMMEVLHHFCRKKMKNPNNADVEERIKKATPLFDGGYTVGGLVGNGTGFVMRDAHGIRPAYYYVNDEVIVAASERASSKNIV